MNFGRKINSMWFHLRWLQIGLPSWIVEARANLPKHQKQQHWQLRHWLLRWQWQCAGSSGGLHHNGWGQPGAAWLGQEVCSGFALAAHATCSRLRLCPRSSVSPTHNNQAMPQKLLWQLCRLSATAVVTGGSSGASSGGSCGDIGCGSAHRSITISGNRGSDSGGSSGGGGSGGCSAHHTDV